MKRFSEMPEQLKATLPLDVINAFNTFSDEELDLLETFYLEETGEFIGLGFIDPDTNKFTKFGDMNRYRALLSIEDHIRLEISRGGSLL